MLEKIYRLIKAEPVAFVTLVSTVCALLVAFGVHLSDVQTGAVIAVVNALLALLLRRRVSPVED